MANVKTAVSLDEPLFEQVEALARELKLSRSRLFALALQEFIRRHESQRLLERINAAYADAPDAEEEALLRGMLRHQREVLEDAW